MFARSSLHGGGATVALFALALLAVLIPAAGTDARPTGDPRPTAAEPGVVVGGAVAAAKTAQDTVLVLGPLGSGAPYAGGFQDINGYPDWQGWRGVDLTAGANHWHADAYHAVSGAYSAWCGEMLPSCGPGDPEGGYGNYYDDVLEWRGTVADPGQPCTVTVTALASHDIEDGYDFARLEVETAGGVFDLWTGTAQATAVPVGGQHVYQPGDYLGEGGDEVVVVFRVTSDGSWSDADCQFQGAGAMQLDDVVVTLDNGAGAAHDFEDGTLGPFGRRDRTVVGDFARIWTGLEDIDPCATNYTPQVAFIDDGVVVPGTGGSPCITWCYGPGGWIVNTTGGLAGPEHELDNVIESPVMAWPGPGYDAAVLSFDVYRHEELEFDSPGIFYSWAVRSAATPEDLAGAPWRNHDLFHFGAPEYVRTEDSIGDMMVPGAAFVQVRLRVVEAFPETFNGDDGTPAPYFDNVRLVATRQHGPALTAEERHLAQDGFPAAGVFDPAAPGAASVRFDMARNIAERGTGLVDPGDSVVIEAVAVREGAVLAGPPRLHYRLRANPAFDAWRTSGLGTEGWVACDTVWAAWGAPLAGRWFADLPDEGFLFPGDVLHYYFTAEDDLLGDVQTTILPADTSGFSDFGTDYAFDPSPYDRRFTVRALPAIGGFSAQQGTVDQPAILFWFDAAADEGWYDWRWMFYQNCLATGVDIDVFATRDPNTAFGNGLGTRATVDLVAGYDLVLYSAGDHTAFTLGDGDAFSDPSPDVQLLSAWLDLGNRAFYAGGDGLAFSLSFPVQSTFLADRLGAQFVSWDLRPLIGDQVAPRVVVDAGEPFGWLIDSWLLAGGCPELRSFDAVTATGNGIRTAQFADPGGATDVYPYAALVRAADPATGSRTLFSPFDLARVERDPYATGGPAVTAGSAVLGSILDHFGLYTPGCIAGVPGGPGGPAPARLAAASHPNPFNPRVRISYTVARAGRLSVRIYDLRGRLVRTLLDGPVAAAGHVDWDGTGGDGTPSASGVYFYEVRMDNDVEVGKLALVR